MSDASGHTIVSLSAINENTANVVSKSLTEYFSMAGLSYWATIDSGTAIASGASIWFNLVPPTAADVAIISRNLMPDFTGAEYQIYLNSAGYSTASTQPIFTTNPIINNIPGTSINILTAAPTTLGTLIDTPIFIGSGGTTGAARAAGTSSYDIGLKFYQRGGTGFFGRIHNTSGSASRIVFRIEFVEMSGSNVLPY